MTEPLGLYVVGGIDDVALSAATMALQWDVPAPVVVRYDIDVHASRLRRVASDITGIVDTGDIDLTDICAFCATREDIASTLRVLSDVGRWPSVVLRLPLATPPSQVCRMVEGDDALRADVSVRSVITALPGESLSVDLTTDDSLTDRGIAAFGSDDRGVAEVAAEMVEYSDIVALMGAVDETGAEFATALARPTALVARGWDERATCRARNVVHDHAAAEDWVDHLRRSDQVKPSSGAVWSIELASARSFHPDRLYDNVERLGGGWFRSRGSFWLPTRPTQVCRWDSAGGQVSIGAAGRWGHRKPITRIVVTGLCCRGDDVQDIQAAFADALVRDDEMVDPRYFSDAPEDGLEPWLGSIPSSSSFSS